MQLQVDYANIRQNGQVFVLDHTFTIPQLNRSRKIWMYLPPDYQIARKRYPVIYMHDGQNLFDESASFAGEWHVEDTLDEAYRMSRVGAIVVGIENSSNGEERIEEYSPWFNEYNQMGGKGEVYMEFLLQELKPYIDRNFRTKPDANHTAMVGSSMGGLITLYAAIKYQHIFGRIGILSPSLWFSEEAFLHVSRIGKQPNTNSRIALLAGAKEPDYVGKATERLYRTLLQAGFHNEDLLFELIVDGEHNEWFWSKAFKQAYQWMFEIKF